ncbi:MAG: hypothetical protein QM755_05510 [Luteolibacter sp.]
MNSGFLFALTGAVFIVLAALSYRRGYFNGGLHKIDRRTGPFLFYSVTLTEGLLGLVLVIFGLRVLFR